MTSRFRPLGWLGLGLILIVGCDVARTSGPILYREHERATTELATKPKLRAAIQTTLVNLYGPDLRHMKLPDNSGLRAGGMYLANQMRVGDRLETVTDTDPATGKTRSVAGGYALYRNHCLHCHGVFGAGDGPTAAGLFPRPRDYRPGVFKFTSTNPTNAKPSRDDLRKTLLYGLHGTSMPGFEATMTNSEIEQVMDYLTFLSIRGETERYLLDDAANAEDADAATTFEPERLTEIVEKVTTSWTEAETQVVNPAARRVAATPASIRRGRDLYLGANTSGPKLECAGCHGTGGLGNGTAFIEQGIFDDVVFRYYSFDEAAARTFRTQQEQAYAHGTQPARTDPQGVAGFLEANPAILKVLRQDHNLMRTEVTNDQFGYLVKNKLGDVAAAARKLLPDLDDPEFRTYLVAKYNLWTQGSLDFWNNPLRPANLINGVYKGGRRPLDLYWRIAKGINGAKMPAHSNILSDDQIWDVINFVLALPDDPNLLKEPAPAAHGAKTAAAPEARSATARPAEPADQLATRRN